MNVNYENLKVQLFDKQRTMVGNVRFFNLSKICNLIIQNNIIGSFVECGTWRGGCCALMGVYAKEENKGRLVFGFDSFEGLPEPKHIDSSTNPKQGNACTIWKQAQKEKGSDWCKSSLEEFIHTLKLVNLTENNVIPVKGWFEHTLLTTNTGPIAILRLDGDWYESTKTCLDCLFNRVVEGGYIIIDDYGYWRGCKKAVDEFFCNNNIKMNYSFTDETEIVIVK